LPAELDTLAGRYAQQVGDTPNDIVLEFVDASVRVYDFPHHLDDAAAAFVVECIIELTGEMVEINRASLGHRGVVDQLSSGGIVESETRFQNGVKRFTPGRRHFAVDGRQTDKQGGGREQAILVLELISRTRVLNQIRDGGFECFKHLRALLRLTLCHPG
jgi:hypothetical protein